MNIWLFKLFRVFLELPWKMCLLRFLAQARGTLGRHLAEASPAAWAAAAADPGRKLHLVMGNESCDLDSAVSALTLAFVYAQRHREHDYVPILNIPRRDYPLKTEVGHLFVKCGIAEPVLLFRDDLPGDVAQDVNVILVDHHVSPLAPQVTEVLDHRPLEESSPSFKQLPTGCELDIDATVGSCATLVAQRYLAEEQPRSKCVAKLLHATIVLDTINFAPAAKRFGPKDLAMVEQLERELNSQVDQRTSLFDELVAARADISKLTLTEVLRKDMKILQTDRQVVPLAGMPILVRDFVEKSGAEKAIREFGVESNLLVMLGMYVSPVDGQVQRDLALISLSGQSQVVERVRQALVESNDPKLELRPHEVDTRFMGGCFLRQHNVQATRKHILPIVKRALLEWEADHGCDCDEIYFFKEKPQLGLS
ncbi:exopolyphosphatase PRUNE1 [Drosophila elegans]|uniref:exopolyphosphatase PRUNE1 n=1 Tax=Drosophila elegans TaxID=30023 RepID=UPI0007E746AE|nr:exopolyphosphatase PRUNE1 [Drosophila elegans]